MIAKNDKEVVEKQNYNAHQKTEVPNSKHCAIKIAKPNHPGNLKEQWANFHDFEFLLNCDLYFHPDVM